MTINIHPDHLLFHLVSTHPLTVSLTHLDRIVLSGLLLFVEANGMIRLTEYARRKLEAQLEIAPQGMSNTIRRLKRERIITGTRGNYLLADPLLPLASVPNGIEQVYTLTFNCHL